ncbi:glycosyltransferase family 39 protein [Sphingomonas sp. BK580]|uniref:glycosyltransferase family 39 protein n=1 Tax=Sphingomonas sp. BK580 TaxID=2586972 RepID=UPI00161624DD|nr:glycosyltransferase family 39 protein [Sphingomonas sp. BK580]MBB3695151.1 putative membrane protein [Sphingomonas sp. BK580]
MEAQASRHLNAGRHGGPASTPGSLMILAGLVAVAFASRVALADHSLWFDEYASVFFASQPLHRLWGPWMLRETNPPLYYTILRGWIEAFGLSRAGVRLPGIIASVAAIAVLFGVISRLYGRRAGVAAALILALSSQQLYFSLQVRAYIFLYLAIAVSFAGVLTLVKATTRRGEVVGWLSYVLGAIAGIYLHTTAIVWPLAATAAMVTVYPPLRPRNAAFSTRAWAAIVLANAAIVLGSAWWLYMTALQVANPNGNLNWMEGLRFKRDLTVYVSTVLQSRQLTVAQLPVAIPFGLFFALGTWRSRREPGTRLALACLVYASALFVIISLKQPVFLPRTILWLSLFPLIIAANGIASLEWRGFVIALTAIMVASIIGLFITTPALVSEEWRGLIRRASADRSAIVFVDGEAMSVVTRMACRVELGLPRCPFPVVTIVAPGRTLDTWGNQYADTVPRDASGQALLPDQSHAYLLRRHYHDALADAYWAGALPRAPGATPAMPTLAGPYDRSLIVGLVKRSVITNGLLYIRGENSSRPHE